MAEVQKKRCAIYTRKSVEEGLDMEFNTLDAQRLAGENYIASQRANGWVCLPQRYDDGGFSGGTLERPALERLLEDAKNGLVDIIVIYKLDRLTRSITDFAALSQKFDEWGVSFVSVTQEINTSTSSGRMMLNILVTFAQYEREVIAERIRDKMSASRRRGQWVGGTIPYGYKSVDRHLIPNPDEAKYVRMIFDAFARDKSPRPIAKWLNDAGVRTRQGNLWVTTKIYNILNNHTYVGEVNYKGEIYPGEHEALVSREQWNRVQQMLIENARTGRGRPKKERYAMLKGMIRCGHCGGAMSPTYSVRRGKQYNYYACLKDSKAAERACPIRTVSAGDIEQAVLRELGTLFQTPTFISLTASNSGMRVADVRAALGEVSSLWDKLFPAERERLLHLLVEQVTIYEDGIKLKVKTNGMKSLIKEVRDAGN